MNRINKKTNTEQVLHFASERLTSDVALMSAKRTKAINVFNDTVSNLESINNDLRVSAQRCRDMAKIAVLKAEEAEKMIADNENVCQKIYEIIGKPAETEKAA